jgi:signal transduction histidine kinase
MVSGDGSVIRMTLQVGGMVKINLFSFEWFPFLTSVILHQRIAWSIRLRFVAVVGFLLATLVARYVFHIAVPYEILWSLLGILALINIIYIAVYKGLKKLTFQGELIVLHFHMIIDLIFLTLILHYSGGMENPVYLFYVFHVVLASIIFPGLIPLVFATFVVFLFGALIYLEYSGLVTHYNIFDSAIYRNEVAIYVVMTVFIATVYVTAYICTTFMQIYRNIKHQIDIQNQQLVELDKQKMQFFRFTSHELKSPIVAVKTSLDGFIKNFGMQIDPQGLNLLERASLRAGQMLDIIRELLELSHDPSLSESRIPEQTDLLRILTEVIQQERPQADEKNINIKFELIETRVVIEGDVSDFKKIFTNLLTNAINYTPAGGWIKVTTSLQGNILTIQFRDSGIGISEQDLPRIFNEFFRAENAKKIAQLGTGLGLSLVKRKVEFYHGEIEVQSKLNQGSTFVVKFPVRIQKG